jgi:hypothetical protein
MDTFFTKSGSSPGTKPQADFSLFYDSPFPTVYLLTPLSSAARAFLDQHISDNATYLGPSLAVEHRFLHPLLAGIDEAGLRVEVLR